CNPLSATKVPAIPTTLPSTKPNLRPKRCIKCADGKVDKIVPVNCNAMGKVINAGWLASCLPIKAATDTNKIFPVVSKAWASANPQTVNGITNSCNKKRQYKPTILRPPYIIISLERYAKVPATDQRETHHEAAD